MHVLIVNYAYDADLKTADELFHRYYILRGWVDGLLAAGARVTVLQRFARELSLERQGASYHFVADAHDPRLRRWQVPFPLHRKARHVCAEGRDPREPLVVHVNGLLFPLPTGLLCRTLRCESVFVVQHHAGRPWAGLRRVVQRWGLARVDGFFFAAPELAAEWIAAGIIPSPQAVHQVMEAGSPLQYQPRAAARAVTGLHGAPVILWTGNLNANKDPLTILAGFETILDRAPQARLYMAYRYADLLPQVKARIAVSDRLRQAVTLLGPIPFSDIATYYNSADLFVQGSAKEGSGLALLDAMACGVVPVVTDIPSFRTITAGGTIGALWPVGDPAAFAEALLAVIRQPLEPASARARGFFQEHWSFPAIGRRALEAYDAIWRGRVRA
jgi:glycosyltransferase involved in cell wall biosynthesis